MLSQKICNLVLDLPQKFMTTNVSYGMGRDSTELPRKNGKITLTVSVALDYISIKRIKPHLKEYMRKGAGTQASCEAVKNISFKKRPWEKPLPSLGPG
jgi:hypothetical protein